VKGNFSLPLSKEPPMLRVRVALNVPRTIPRAIVYAQSIAAALKGNPAFPSPTPSIPSFEADLAALEASQVRTLTHIFGAAAERDARFASVMSDLDVLRNYVETVANQSAADAAAIIESSGMSVRGAPGHGKPPFEAKQGRTPETAHLVARAAKTRGSYDWQQSSDGVTWIDLPRTVRADAEVTGLTAGVRYWFRYRTLTKEGVSAFRDVVSLLVG
jgi:hypothetical protein